MSDLHKFKDNEFLVDQIASPLEHIAGALSEILERLEEITEKGATINISLKVGGSAEDVVEGLRDPREGGRA